MNPSNKTVRIRAGATVVVSVGLVVLAFLRGDYLLGFGYGVAWGVLATLGCWLAIRIAFDEARALGIRCGLLLLVLLPLGTFLAYPQMFSQQMDYVIEVHARERESVAELQAVFTSDPDFHDLSVSINHNQIKSTMFTVQVSGSVPSRAHLYALHERVAEECPVAHSESLCWNVKLQDTGKTLGGADKRLFSSWHDDIKNLEWRGR